jgi:hypothetical protein
MGTCAIQIGLLVFPRVQQFDVTAPYEVFAYVPDTKMHLVWKTLEPVSSITESGPGHKSPPVYLPSAAVRSYSTRGSRSSVAMRTWQGPGMERIERR